MRTRFKIISSLSLLAALLTGCNFFGGGGNDNNSSSGGGNDNPPVTEDSYTITWKNYDGSILEIDEKVSSGSMPSYDGNTPIKISTQQFSYTFSGWSPSIKMVTSDVTYVAQFSETINTYTITWDIEGSKTTEVYNYGEIPSYKNGTPTKASTEQYSYSFSGWYPEITSVTADKTYIAQYNQLVNSYTINFVTNGGDSISPITGAYGDPVVIPTPTKGNFFFVGWFIDESLTNKANISTMPGENITLYAKWVEMYTVFEIGSKQYMYFGAYPQSVVSDTNVINELTKITTTNCSGYYEYNGCEYAKHQVHAANSFHYTYSNGSKVNSDSTEYFKVEPILWRVLASDSSGNYTLLADQALYACRYDHGLNNYANSEIRSWINNDFFNSAFKTTEKGAILTTTVDNSPSTTNSNTNPYACENTSDKVFLLSYKDYINPAYGFSSSYNSYDSARYCKPTDYALANYCWMNVIEDSYDRNCYYWTRSPHSDDFRGAWYVYSNGGLDRTHYVGFEDLGVRPALVVKNVSIDPTQDEEWSKNHGVIPVMDEINKTITYGLYPQTNVNDSSLISSLNALTSPESNGWYLYNNEYYAKVSANPYGTNYEFDNGTVIENGTTYWFKCEPITWNILSNNNGEYYILSSVLLDTQRFGECYSLKKTKTDYKGESATVYANNYKFSDIRTWLNTDFYNTAFALGNSNIQTTFVDNSPETIGYSSNPYACDNTQDKVFLPSHQDYTNSNYGFSTSYEPTNTRYCKTTDWARAKGVLYNGWYWTRSPSGYYYDFAWRVDYDGYLYSSGVDRTYGSVRPGLSIKIA